jgi:hypothetical protein
MSLGTHWSRGPQQESLNGLRFLLSLAWTVPTGTLLGVYTALVGFGPPWLSVHAGVLVAVFFVLLFSGGHR